MTGSFVIEPLDAHDRSAFRCGTEALDRYLREQASQDVKRLMANCFLAIDMATKAIAGYYTLAATGIPATDLPPDMLKRLPRYSLLPAALVGRLAVDQRFHHKGLGGAMLADAAFRVLKGDTKAFALVVDAKDDGAVAFYEHHGFQRFVSKPQSQFLPLETLKEGATKRWCLARIFCTEKVVADQGAHFLSKDLRFAQHEAGADPPGLG